MSSKFGPQGWVTKLGSKTESNTGCVQRLGSKVWYQGWVKGLGLKIWSQHWVQRLDSKIGYHGCSIKVTILYQSSEISSSDEDLVLTGIPQLI